MQTVKVQSTTQYSLGNASDRDVSTIVFQTVGLSGTCSVVPKIRIAGSGATGTTLLVAVPYINRAAPTTVIAAGTAITTDGIYQVDSSGSELVLDATVSSGSAVVRFWPLAGGGSGVGSGGGGGGGGAITIANGADVALGSTTDAPAASPTTTAAATVTALLKQIANNTSAATSNAIVPTTTVDPTNSFTMPTMDVASRGGFMFAQGLAADAASGAGINGILIGGNDTGGLVRTGLMSLLSTTTMVSTSTYGLTTFSQLAAIGSANVVRGLASGGGLGDGGSGATALGIAPLVWNGTTWDRKLGSIGDGSVNRPYALSSKDWHYTPATGGITTATTTVLKTAAGASIRNFLTTLHLENNSATGTEFEVRDGATAIFFSFIPGNTSRTYQFTTPPKTTANTALNLVTATGGIILYANAYGYIGA